GLFGGAVHIGDLRYVGGVSTASRRLRAALLASVLFVAGVPGAARATPPHPARPATAAHSVTYDGYSWLVDGMRVYLWSGEFHYFRLPSPDLWRDVLTSM